ncbi:MAG TPA: ANTAR domain-containing protein [Actinomycetes bacterium]|jgi:AmiR/NasT family two-component response regulator|nr:ANTAR domain-containing protein [Actinomycetes bacterium]
MTTFLPQKGTSAPAESHTDLEECQSEVEDLKAALTTRPVIDQAKGILMAERGCSPEEAFTLLSTASQRDNRKVRDIARAIVDNAQQEPDRKP